MMRYWSRCISCSDTVDVQILAHVRSILVHVADTAIVQYIYWSIWLILLIRNNWSMWLILYMFRYWSMWLILYMFRYWSMWLILYMFRYWSMWLIPAPCEPYLPLLCDSSNAVNRADLVSNC